MKNMNPFERGAKAQSSFTAEDIGEAADPMRDDSARLRRQLERKQEAT